MHDLKVLFYKKIIIYSFIIIFLSSIGLNLFLSLKTIKTSNITDELKKLENRFNMIVNAEQLPETVEISDSPFDISVEVNENDSTEKEENKNYDILRYQELYPELYSSLPENFIETGEQKIVYLTFDDGPSIQTEVALNILKEKGIKATFFVMPDYSEFGTEIYNRILNEGHAIGIHTYTHNYNKIYYDVESYLYDFNKIYNHIYDKTGYKPNIFRFPGGSINSYNILTYNEIISEMLRRGFIYYDWNIDSGDADSSIAYTANNVHQRVVSGVNRSNKSIVLFHDSKYKSETMNALPSIIDDLKNSGYIFDVITHDVKPFIFAYPN